MFLMVVTSIFAFFLSAEQKLGSVDDLIYNVDIDGSSLLHLAANSGVLAVSKRYRETSIKRTPTGTFQVSA